VLLNSIFDRLLPEEVSRLLDNLEFGKFKFLYLSPERLQQEIDKYNQKFGKWERIKDFEITQEEWTVESGHLTPTMKMRRKVILEKHKDLFEKIYKL